jgi:hypothetical protein
VGNRRTCLILFLISVFTSTHVFAIHTAVHSHRKARGRRARHVRRAVWNPLFHGSHEMLVRENEVIDQLELPRIANDEELLRLEDEEELVRVESTRYLTVASNLTDSRRYARPWTRDFLEDLSQAYYEKFHQPLMVTSLVRTMAQQKKLRRHNRNAAPEEGETASTHLTGSTVDILKRGMSRKQHQWIEQYFLPLKTLGLIEPIEERRQPVFHVMVMDGYSDWREAQGNADEAAQTTASNQ